VRSLERAIGLDVHRDFCEVAIVESGALRSAGRIATTPEALELFAHSLAPTDRVALEVTGSAWEIARLLEPHVAGVVVVSPADTGICQARAKTDRLDARTLARLLWAGELDPVWMPDEPTKVLRPRLGRREQLVRARSRPKNEIQAVLVRRLLGRPPVSDLFGVSGASGWQSSSCRSRRRRLSRPACATSSFSTPRSPRSSARSPGRRFARRSCGGC
jgi:transposase